MAIEEVKTNCPKFMTFFSDLVYQEFSIEIPDKDADAILSGEQLFSNCCNIG